VLLTLAAACQTPSATTGPVAVRDSAGARIVENLGDTAAVPPWALDEQVRIGGRPDSAPYDLNSVRHAARLSDGRVLAWDNAAMELRFFDSADRYLRTTGRRGQGPGEFQSVSRFWLLPGDTIELMDSQHRRLTRVSPSGEVLWSRRVEVVRGEMTYAWPVGRKNPDTLLAIHPDNQGGEINRQVGERFRSYLNVVAMAEGGPLDTLVTVPDRELFVILWNEGGGDMKAYDRVVFSASATARIAGGRIHVGHGAGFMIDTYTLDGALERSSRLALAPAPVTAADREAWAREERRVVEQWRGTTERMRELTRKKVREAPMVETLPAFETFDVGTDGALWIELYRRPGDQVRRYLILDSTGVLAARVTFPPRTRPTHFGAEHVVAVQRDEDEVEYVVVYRVARERPTASAERYGDSRDAAIRRGQSLTR
jgi:hypothetical protein